MNIMYQDIKLGTIMRNITHRRGFSLTELSMVLVITAIIIAGALQGRVIINAANVRAVIAEVTEHRTSLNSFYSKYEQFPGDFDDATTYWDPPGAAVTENGNGNGQIGFIQDSVYEGFRAWEHLSYARMTEGAFVGTETTGTPVLETDVPPSRTKGGYFFDYDVMGLSEYNVLLLGTVAANSASPTVLGGVVTPSIAMDIDAKADDGVPTTGFVRGDDDGDVASVSSCVSSSVYDIDDSDKSCVLGFRINRFD